MTWHLSSSECLVRLSMNTNIFLASVCLQAEIPNLEAFLSLKISCLPSLHHGNVSASYSLWPLKEIIQKEMEDKMKVFVFTNFSSNDESFPQRRIELYKYSRTSRTISE